MNRLNHMRFEAHEDMIVSRNTYRSVYSVLVYELYRTKYLTICAIVDCIRKSYKKVRE